MSIPAGGPPGARRGEEAGGQELANKSLRNGNAAPILTSSHAACPEAASQAAAPSDHPASDHRRPRQHETDLYARNDVTHPNGQRLWTPVFTRGGHTLQISFPRLKDGGRDNALIVPAPCAMPR